MLKLARARAQAAVGYWKDTDPQRFRGPDPHRGLRTALCFPQHLAPHPHPLLEQGGGREQEVMGAASQGRQDGEVPPGPVFFTLTPHPGRSRRQAGFFLPTCGSGSCLKD